MVTDESATGRLRHKMPPIQNVPGSPAAFLERHVSVMSCPQCVPLTGAKPCLSTVLDGSIHCPECNRLWEWLSLFTFTFKD